MAWVALLLGVGQVVLILTSWLLTAAMPENFPRSLLSAEGIRWFFGRFVGNVESPLLVWLLLFSFMLGALQHSGILHYRSSEYRQRIAMRLALFEGIFFLLLILALVLVPHAILLNVMGGPLAQQFLCQYRALLLFFPDGDECQFRCDERPDEGRRLRLRGSCLGRWQDGRFAAHLCHWRPALPQHYLPLLSLIR